jgi:hypothetical protein
VPRQEVTEMDPEERVDRAREREVEEAERLHEAEERAGETLERAEQLLEEAEERGLPEADDDSPSRND